MEELTPEQQQWVQTQIATQLATCLDRFAQEIQTLSQDYRSSVGETGYASASGH